MNNQTKENVLFISGIDTNVGKTVATGMIAKALAKAGKKVITGDCKRLTSMYYWKGPED